MVYNKSMRDLSENNIWLTLFYARLFGQNLTKEQLWQRLLLAKDGQILPKSQFDVELKTFIDQGLLLEDKEKRLFWLSAFEKNKRDEKEKIFLKKWILAKKSVKLIKKLPFIKGIAITGSVAGENCEENDDLDFLVITAKNRVYWGRFFCYFLAMIKQKKRNRKQQNNAWCFNLFLAEDKLEIPLSKRNLYGASQLKLLKELWEKDNCLRRLKQENLWLNDWFNQQAEIKNVDSSGFFSKKESWLNNFSKKVGDFGEKIMRKMQQYYMSMKITNELIEERQIFFHPLKRRIENQKELQKLWKKELSKWQVTTKSEKMLFLIKEKKSEIGKEKALLTGSFDLLHQEHLFFIKEAMKKSQQLFIGIESDERVKKNKGKERPIYNQDERRIRLQNLFPDVVVFILPENFGEKKIRATLLKKLMIKKMFIASNDQKREIKKQELNQLKIEVETIKARQTLSMSMILEETSLSKAMVFKFDRQKIQLSQERK